MNKLFFFSIIYFFLIQQSVALDLFGYKLEDDIFKYKNHGAILYDKENIEAIELNKEKVLIANGYINKYLIKATKAGKIYEIQGSNNQLDISPVECLEIQKKFLTSFEEKNSSSYKFQKKILPVNLKSKTTWDIYLSSSIYNHRPIFTVTCDYSFNNRRMDITLSDKDFLKKENTVFENLQKKKKEKIRQEKIDTSGI